MNKRLFAWNLAVQLIFERDRKEFATSLRQAVASIPELWTEIISVANANLVTATLWSALRRSDVLGDVPEDAAEYLRSFHGFNHGKNNAVLAQLRECIDALNRRGIEPMPIKGAAYLLSDLYPDVGDRFFTDIDLLLPTGSIHDARGAMGDLGYSELPNVEFDHSAHHHLPPLFRERTFAALELHMAAVPGYADPALSSAALWTNAVKKEDGGIRYYLPAATDAAMLSFIHTEIVDRHLTLLFIPLRALYDLRLLQARFGADIDWGENFRRASAIRATGRLRRFLHALYRLSNEESLGGLAFRPSDSLHFSMCKAAIAWPVVPRWTLRLERLTERKIRERYHVERGGVAAVNLCRLRELGAMIAHRHKD